jgi:hypothetical protein
VTHISSSGPLTHLTYTFTLQNSVVSNLKSKLVIFYIKSISFMVCKCVLVYSCFGKNHSIRSWLTTCLSGWGCYTGEVPFSQLDVQNMLICPLCTCTRVAATKRASSTVFWQLRVVPCFSGFFHWYQSHLILRAHPNLSKLVILSPPRLIRRHTWDRLTLHFPLCSCWLPAQRNLCLSLSISF